MTAAGGLLLKPRSLCHRDLGALLGAAGLDRLVSADVGVARGSGGVSDLSEKGGGGGET